MLTAQTVSHSLSVEVGFLAGYIDSVCHKSTKTCTMPAHLACCHFCHCLVANPQLRHVQVWLQRFAWTERKLASRIEKRNALPKDPTLLRDEPMFCFETAVKLLYWAGFVYEHEEVRVLILSISKSYILLTATPYANELLLWFAAQFNFILIIWIAWLSIVSDHLDMRLCEFVIKLPYRKVYICL